MDLGWCFCRRTGNKKMRRAMFESVIFYGIVAAITVPTFGNYGLWLSVSGLFICRAVTLLVRYRSLETSLSLSLIHI